ncbi:hypothetical protein VTO42DRAFT_1166 [Malbranchea cinnamomea]
MGRSEPPFLYDPLPRDSLASTLYGNFNPKAVTEASWAPRPPRPQKNAPLINFNRHPDSYAVIPTGKDNVKMMSPRTKGRVKHTRFVLLGLRVLTLMGALGLLFCVICISKTSGVVSWLIRVGPALSTVHTVYAVFHLCRSTESRPPASSASYMLFAAVLDAGLIPFYVFTAIMAKIEHKDQTYGWETLFQTDLAADKILYSTFLGCSIVGGLHLAALTIDLYLAIVFRKIAKLPPDMNPLEDRFTARSHKRSRSEIAEKHLSGSTAVSSNGNRDSLTKDPLAIPTRPVSFIHTRINSEDSLHDRNVEDEKSSYYSAQSHRYSRSDLPSQITMQYEKASQRKPAIARARAQKKENPPRPQSAVISTPSPFDVSQLASVEVHPRDPSGVSSLTTTADNWYTYGSEPPSPMSRTSGEMAREKSPFNTRPGSPDNRVIGYHDAEHDLGYNGNMRNQEVFASQQVYNEEENVYDKAHTENLYSREVDLGESHNLLPEEENSGARTRLLMNPLEMNPPTPRPPEAEKTGSIRSKRSIRREALVALSNPPASSGRSTPAKSPHGSKLRNYGELSQSPIQRDTGTKDDDNGTPETPSKNTKTRWQRRSGKLATYKSLKADADDSDGEGATVVTPGEADRKGRVVSNTGINLGAGLGSGSPGYSSYIAGLGVGRRRDVSGKVAEEGRAGQTVKEGTETPLNSSRPRRLSKTREYKAAGWSRWKGL